MRKPNSQECSYFGRKLGNVITDIEADEGVETYIGSENDDIIYFPPDLEGEMLKERVKLSVGDEFISVDLDLEDIIRFSAKYCRGIVERVMEEEK